VKKVLVTLLELLGVIRRQGNCALLALPRYTPTCRTPRHVTHANQPKNQDFEHFMSNFIATCSLPSLQCFISWEDFGCSEYFLPPNVPSVYQMVL